MNLYQRLHAGYQNEIEKMAQAEELLNFQVRCLYKSAEAEGVAHELHGLADEEVIKIAQELDADGAFDAFYQDPSVLLTEEEIKMAADAEHADLMGRYMARSFADETRKLAHAEEVLSDEDVQLAYESVFGKEAKAFKALKDIGTAAKGAYSAAREGSKGVGASISAAASKGKETFKGLDAGTAARLGAAAGVAGTAGLGAAGYGAKKMLTKKSSAEFEIAAVDYAGQLRDFAVNSLPQGEDLTLDKVASMVPADEHEVLVRAWEILGEQGILA